MSKVAVIGAGHVGVIYAAGLAELGHSVRVVDVDRSRILKLREREIWFHEPGLPELTERAVARGRLLFTTSHREALTGAEFAFVCVPTPTTSDGSLDDSMLRSAFESIASSCPTRLPIIVNKSTVPVGSSALVTSILGARGGRVVSSPEFLSEGNAVHDFFHPSRIVLGSSDRKAAEDVALLFAGIHAPIVYTDNVTAEFSKLAANSFLAMKISFANALARLCEAVGADADAITQVLALDPRIGQGHLRAGLGFGGSCLPKDVAAIEHMARRYDANPDLFAAVLRVNRDQRTRVVDFLMTRFEHLAERKIAILGIAFKAGTDDVRESPGLALAQQLVALHAVVRIYDPLARTVPNRPEGPRFARSALAAAKDADAVIVATEWPEFAGIDLKRLRKTMRGNVLIDGRGVLPLNAVRENGFDYFGFGRGGIEHPLSAVSAPKLGLPLILKPRDRAEETTV